MKWQLPESDTYFRQFAEGGFQREHLLAAFDHVRSWDCAIDVGAHAGFWTRDMAARFRSVHAIEPADDTFRCLRLNTADLPNVQLYHAAAGRDCGRCAVIDDRDRPGNTGARFIETDEEGSVDVITIDDLALDACDLLKVDVEGHELFVLQGADWTIAAFRPVIVMETDKKFAERYGLPRDAAEKHLLSLGYREVAHMRPDKVFVPR